MQCNCRVADALPRVASCLNLSTQCSSPLSPLSRSYYTLHLRTHLNVAGPLGHMTPIPCIFPCHIRGHARRPSLRCAGTQSPFKELHVLAHNVCLPLGLEHRHGPGDSRPGLQPPLCRPGLTDTAEVPVVVPACAWLQVRARSAEHQGTGIRQDTKAPKPKSHLYTAGAHTYAKPEQRMQDERHLLLLSRSMPPVCCQGAAIAGTQGGGWGGRMRPRLVSLPQN